MQSEIIALKQNETWGHDILFQTKIIGYKWVFKTKFNADGSLDKYKARLFAKGHNQIEGIDYTGSFVPVSKMTTLKTLISIASNKKWHLHQMDVQNTFLHGEL